MAKLISSGKDNRFTILPYSLDTPIQEALISHPSNHVIGYITEDKDTCERKFFYTESGVVTAVKDHWSLAILKESLYVEENGPWIVYSCSPQEAKVEFGKLLSHTCLWINNWDTWSVEVKDGNVAVITSWEIY